MQITEDHRCFGGSLKVIEHQSTSLNCTMKFSIFAPANADPKTAPVLMFLSGLTCTHDNFTTKAGAYKKAAALGMIIIAPDTSPRGDDVPDDADSYDFGKGAGFYINATQPPWSTHYHMEDYIAKELPALLADEFSIRGTMGVCGHSMGGHGALTLYFKYPEVFRSCSAFAPIVAPTQVPWGHKAFTDYLGSDTETWKHHDACTLVATSQNKERLILIDQGLGDQFLDDQLKPDLFQQACDDCGQAVSIRLHDGYDHSYYFIQTFIDDHLDHHKELLEI